MIRRLLGRKSSASPKDLSSDIDIKAMEHFQQGRYVEAEMLWRHSLISKEQKVGSFHPFLVGTLNNLVASLSELGNYSEAVKFSERMLDILEQQLGSEDIQFAKGLGTLGVLLAGSGNHVSAEEAMRQCHTIMEKKLDFGHPDVAKSLLNLAGILYLRGSYSEAEPLFHSNLLILEEQLGAEHFDLVEPLNNLAGCLCKLGNYAEAEPLYQRSLILREKYLGAEHPDIALALNNMATYFAYLGNYVKAEQFYRRSQTILVKLLGSDSPAVADGLGNLGNLYNSNGEYTKAEPLLRSSLAILIKFFGHEDFAVAKSLRNLSGCLGNLGKLDEAVELCRRSIYIMKKRVGPDDSEVAVSQATLANLLGASNQSAEAKSLFHRSLATLERQLGPSHSEVANVLICLAKNLNESNRTPVAIFCAKKAINIFQKVRMNISSIDEAHLQYFDTSLESIYGYLADLLIKSGRYGEAEYVMGMLKDKELFELLRRDIQCDLSIKSVAWNSVEAPHINKFDKITTNLNVIGKQIDIIKQIKNRYPEQNRELAELEEKLYNGYGELSKFFDNLNDEIPASYSANIDNNLFKFIDLTGTAPNVVAVVPIAAEDNFTTLVVTPHDRKPFSSEYKRDELSKKILKFRELLKDPESYEYLPLAKELYDIIIRPIEKYLNDKSIDTILWMLNGALRLLPLSALHDGKQFMLEHFSNVCISTISNNQTEKHEPWNALGMGVTYEDDRHQALPAVKEELEGIIRIENSTGVLPGEILLNESFTQENMRTRLAVNYKVAHFATHFELNPVSETMSYLLLGDGRKLRMDELRGIGELFKGLDLVAFSACNTGLGTTGAKGREVDGIGYLGELLGARTVLASLWQVHDSSTSKLMCEFYRVRENGNSKAKALQKAQISMLKGNITSEEGHDFTHPFFWSPFILIGNGG